MIDWVFSPVLHNKAPVAVVEIVVEPQLFTMVTSGAGGVTLGAAIPEPA